MIALRDHLPTALEYPIHRPRKPRRDRLHAPRKGDLRLGLDPVRIGEALTKAGFEHSSTAPARDRFHHPRCGEPLEMFLATGHKPARVRKTKSQ